MTTMNNINNPELHISSDNFFILEEFKVADQGFNFSFINHANKPDYPYTKDKYCLFYAEGDEVELVKNFLMTIRGGKNE